MKKALVVFLILAVAGGLFAEFSWSGNLSSGIGVGFDDTDADPVLGIVRNRGENGLQVQFVFNGKVASENYGTVTGSLGFRGSLDRFGGADGTVTRAGIEDPRVKWELGGPLGLTLQIGAGGPAGTATMGGWNTTLTAGEGNGLAVQLKPVAGLTVAASAIFGLKQATFDQIVWAGGVRYDVPDLLSVAANLNFDQTKTDEKQKLNVAAGVSLAPLVKALGFTALAFDVRTANGLGSTTSDIGIGENIGFAAGDLSLSLGARQLLLYGTDDAAHDFIPMRYNLGVTYKVSDMVTLGIDGRYVIGATPDWNYRVPSEGFDLAWGKDKSGFGIAPYATFSLGGPTVQLGYNLRKDMTDGVAPAAGAPTLQHLIYGTVSVNF